MRGVGIYLTSVALIFFGGCSSSKESTFLSRTQPTTITEPVGVRPHYHWRHGRWKWNRKQQMHVWEAGNWVNKRRHTKWVKGHWVETANGKKYMEGHWE